MRTQFTDLVRFGWQMLSGYRYRHETEIADRRSKDIKPYLQGSSSLRTLDLANGQLRPQTLILSSQGNEIYGIDMINCPQSGLTGFGYKYARRLFSRQIGVSWSNLNKLNLICGDVHQLPFKENYFDLITSVAAFEHFLDVPTVIEEMYRVIKPGGIIWISIHLFSSLSGGHNIKVMEIPLQRLPKSIDPWDHLRKRKLPFRVPLNEWRRDSFIEEISKHFVLLNHYCAVREGENLITPEIKTELSDFSMDDLTCRTYVIIAKKG